MTENVWNVSFWYKDERFEIEVPFNNVRLDELLICIEEQFEK